MKIVKQLLKRLSDTGDTTGARAPVAPAPLIMALEPRVVYDASVAAVASHPHGAEADSHASATSSLSATPKPVAEHDVKPDHAAKSDTNKDSKDSTTPKATESGAASGGGASHQVVFIDPSVANYQALIAGLPAGTQYVVLNANTDGFAQIAAYLQTHKGVESIHLISHGADGEIQAGSTWLNAGDLSAYSAELAQIGAEMRPGGDFLIYGCDVAQNADGKALVQNVAALTHLNVAASTDPTGLAALGGNWTLEYTVGDVHTPVIESAAAQAQYNALLGVTTENYDNHVSPAFSTTGTSFTIDGVTYTTDQAVETDVYTQTTDPFGPPPLSTSSTDGVLMVNFNGTQMSSLTITLASGQHFALQSFDIDAFTDGSIYIIPNGDTSKEVLLVSGGLYSATKSLASNPDFQNLTSVTIKDVGDDGFLTPTLNNFTYTVLGTSATTSVGSAAFTAGDNVASTPVAVDNGITLSDPQSATAQTATVSITGNLHSGEDVLSFVNDGLTMGNITATYNSGTGILSMSSSGGTATLAQWQSALRAVTYTDTAITPNTATRTITFNVSDGISAGVSASRTVTVADTDQTPTLASTSSGATYLAGSASTPVFSGVTIGDRDNTTMSSATVSISGNFHSGDVLSFTNDGSTMGNITGIYNAGTGVMSLTSSGGTATLAQWDNAIDAIRFSDASNAPTGARTVSFTVNDGSKNSAALSNTVTVTSGPTITLDSGSAAFVAGDNTASTPVAVDSGLTVSDGSSPTLQSVTVSITGNFHSGEDMLGYVNNPATMGNISGSYNTGTGILTLTSAGGTASLLQWQSALRSITYSDTAVTPSPATRTISYVANDGSNTSAAVSRTVTVTDTDQTPTLSTSSSGVSYVAGTAATPVFSGVSIADRDNTTMSQATVSIGSGFVTGQDALSFVNDGSTMGNITASYNTTTGVMTLSSAGSTATLAQWDNALNAVRFSDAVSGSPGARTISLSVSDGTKNSLAVTNMVTVTAVPVVTTDSGSAAFVAADNGPSTPVTIDAGLTVSDAGSSTLQSATVSITGNYHSDQDVLSFINNGTMGDITASYNASTGVMTLTSASGTATLAQWQSALQAITYTDTAVTPNTATRTISFTVNDGAQNSAVATRSVTVTDTDQTPILTTTGGSTAFTAGDNTTSTPVAIDGGITVSDLDNTTLASATVAITGNLHTGEDVLGFNNINPTLFGNISASYNALTGVLTMSSAGGTATVAQWQNALDAVTYTNSAITPNAASRTVSFSVNDGTQDSATVTKVVTVADVDQTPVVTTSGGSASFTAGDNAPAAPVAVDNGITVSDRDNTTLASATVSIGTGFHAGEDVLSFINNGVTMGNIGASYNAATGVLTLTSTGASATLAQWQAALRSVTYTDTAVTPDTATRTIGFAINDGTKTSTLASRNVTVADTDQTPILTTSGGSSAFVAGDNTASTPVTVDAGVTLSDLDNSTLASGTVAITGNFHAGEDVLSFTNDGATMGNITATYDAATGVLTLSSTGASATLAQWQAALRSVTYTDTAITPNNANRTLSFFISDGTKTSATGTKTVTVTDTDQTPLASASGTTIDYVAGTGAQAVFSGVAISDLDNTTLASGVVSITSGFQSGDTLSYVNTSSLQFGNITGSYNAATGVLTLTSSGATATDAQWQNAFAAVTFANSPTSPLGNRTVSFTVNDGVKNSAAVSNTVDVLSSSPNVTLTGGSTAFTAGDNTVSTPVTLDGGLTITDPEAGTLGSATVSIGTGFHAGEDVLMFTNDGATMGNITAAYDASTGVLTLNSSGQTATLAQWQAALRAVSYTDTAVTPDTTSRTVSFQINDGIQSSTVASKTVTVADVDQTPVLSTSSGSTAFTAGDNTVSTPVTVDGGVTVSDLDNPTLASATVSVTGGFHVGEDVLAFVNGNAASFGNISGSYNATTGVLTLTSSGATATLAQWQAALQSVTYTDTAVTPDNTMRTISFTVNDGTKDSAVGSKQVTVADVDQTPVLTTWSGSTSYNSGDNAVSTPVVVDGGLTVSDLDNGTLASATVSVTGGFHAGQDVLSFRNDGATMGNITVTSYDATTGVLTLSSSGATATLAQWQAALRSVTYTDTAAVPDAATRTISFTVNDSTKDSAAGTKAITITATDQTPVVSIGNDGSPTFASGPNANPVTIAPQINVTDADSGGTLASATVSITGGFQSDRDVLAFHPSGATGSITATYDAATGVLTLNAAGPGTTLAQWQAALASVTYADRASETSASSRTISFSVNDGHKTSEASTRTVKIAAAPQVVSSPPPTTQSGQPAPATPTTLPPKGNGVSAAGPSSAPPSTPSAFDAPAPDTVITFPRNLTDSISNPLIVLDAFAEPPEVGSIPATHTATFTADEIGTSSYANSGSVGGSNRHGSLSDTSVGPIETTPAPTSAPLSLDLPALAMHLNVAPDQPFVVSLPVMLGSSEGLPVGADAHVELRLADGRPLPAWLHYDPVRGTLSGKVPANQRSVQIAIIAHDAQGHQTRRDVAIEFGGATRSTHSGQGAHDAPHGAARAPAAAPNATPAATPHAALPFNSAPLAKPSLAEQFVRAHATLHLARPATAAAPETVSRGNA